MLGRLASAVLMVVLVAPAVAMCAGATQASSKPGNHDCCPPEMAGADASMAMAMPMPSPMPSSMNDSCCRLSDDAGQRVPSVAVPVAAAPNAIAAVPAFFRFAAIRSLQQIHTAPLSSDHVPRHLLLSVLIV